MRSEWTPEQLESRVLWRPFRRPKSIKANVAIVASLSAVVMMGTISLVDASRTDVVAETYLQQIRELPGEQQSWSDDRILDYGTATCASVTAGNEAALDRDYFDVTLDFLCPDQIVHTVTLRQQRAEQLAKAWDEEICKQLTDDSVVPYGNGGWERYVRDLATTENEVRTAVAAGCPAKMSIVDKIAQTIQSVQDWQERLDAKEVIGTGNYLVGTDISAGRYRATYLAPFAPTEDVENYCFWERSAEDGGVIDNSIMAAGTQATVSVRDGEYLTLQDCGYWELISGPKPSKSGWEIVE